MTHGSADFDVKDFDSREAGDKNVYVKFFMKPFQNEEATAEEGRPIYYDREYIEIRSAGNDTNVVKRPVGDMDRRRFAAAYRLFQAGEEEQIIGTPLLEAPWITRSQVEELAYLRVRTLEQLSSVGDDVCNKVPGLYKLKQRAAVMLEKAEKAAPFIAMQRENETLTARLAALEETVKQQAALLKKQEKGT